VFGGESEVIVQATFRTGPVGTGVYLVGHQGSWAEPHDVDVWLLLLFFPLVPLSRWRVTASLIGEGIPEERPLELALHARSRVPVVSVLRRVSRATGVTVLTFLLLGFAVWKVGTPWAASVLTALLGSVLSPGLLGKLSMAMEMGVVLAGAAVPIFVLMDLDERTPRVRLTSAWRARTAE
jgi:hypothetical protein